MFKQIIYNIEWVITHTYLNILSSTTHLDPMIYSHSDYCTILTRGLKQVGMAKIQYSLRPYMLTKKSTAITIYVDRPTSLCWWTLGQTMSLPLCVHPDNHRECQGDSLCTECLGAPAQAAFLCLPMHGLTISQPLCIDPVHTWNSQGYSKNNASKTATRSSTA